MYHQTAVVPRESILRTEVEWLNLIKADLVVSDVVPVACRAAADAGIRSVCVTNFRKNQAMKVVCIPAPAAAGGRTSGEVVPSDLWPWRKYSQKPIKGSPYPRYLCAVIIVVIA
ncbi:hypothetical protein E2562_033383 [Oryza meyeriana var. granulata]|uniref:WRKY domain-containing protein n=1 Tax=Oryza meyeriana var. granulata TaxID=110450 RepID=A0A6G1C1G9_9ORYZ|nr:hypothetical protein E2562_033383 [Oryza meyeriana var. granulata]